MSLMRDVEHAYYHPRSTLFYESWDITWSGWQSSPHMLIEFGYWVANRDGELVYSTVGGVLKKVNVETEPVDMTIVESVRQVYPVWSILTAKDKLDLAIAAASNLMRYLKSGLDSPPRPMV